jgi:glycosyltransferase involved in cell wall biosynthesis
MEMAALAAGREPAVSVVLPVYNGAPYLRAAVESILGQTFTDFELIAVDDGSRDSSLSILQDYAAADARVKVISRPNTGIAGALNDGIAAARGPLLARMDADDIALPTRFEKQVAFFAAHPEVVLLGSRVLLVDPYDSPVYESDHQTEHDAIVELMLAGSGWSVVHPASMMRTAAVRAVGGYQPSRVPTEDLDLFLRLVEQGRVANLPEVLLRYRQHLRSANHTRVAEQDRNKRAILTEAFARRGMTLPADWTPPKRKVISLEQELDMWGWVALRRGNKSVARKHGWQLLKRAPASAGSWRLMFCALRGR